MNHINQIHSEDVNLLIVDDDELILRLTCRIFQYKFAQVFSTTRTDTGLSIIEEQLVPNSIVLSDFQNPISPYNGDRLALLSETIRLEKNIPFILMSSNFIGNWSSKDLSWASVLKEKHKIDGFIGKPFNVSEIQSTILDRYKTIS